MSEEKIKEWLDESIKAKEGCKELAPVINQAANVIIDSYKNGGKLLIFGNGGSAADAQHVAGEMINKFRFDRKPLPCIALTTDTSVITAIGNDFDDGFDKIFSKQVEAHGNEGDVAIIITTSDVEGEKHGHSADIYYGIEACNKKGMKVIGILSEKSEKVSKMVDISIMVPARDTPRIQEAHITILHMICDLVESGLFKQ